MVGLFASCLSIPQMKRRWVSCKSCRWNLMTLRKWSWSAEEPMEKYSWWEKDVWLLFVCHVAAQRNGKLANFHFPLGVHSFGPRIPGMWTTRGSCNLRINQNAWNICTLLHSYNWHLSVHGLNQLSSSGQAAVLFQLSNFARCLSFVLEKKT